MRGYEWACSDAGIFQNIFSMCFVCSYRSTKPKLGDTDHLKTSGSQQQQQLHAFLAARSGAVQTRRSRKLYEDIGPGAQAISPDEGYVPIPMGIDGAMGNPARFRYPLTPPEVKFRIGVISDLDMDSIDPSDPGKWLSYLREGNLYIQQDKLDPSRTNVSLHNFINYLSI